MLRRVAGLAALHRVLVRSIGCTTKVTFPVLLVERVGEDDGVLFAPWTRRIVRRRNLHRFEFGEGIVEVGKFGLQHRPRIRVASEKFVPGLLVGCWLIR